MIPMKKRYLVPHILRDLSEKMVFIGGARQVGKTSLARYIAENYFKSHDYLNWDARDDRRNILQSKFKGDAGIVLFDEIHKYKDWKNYLKGQFDKHKGDFKILVTGSARLDVYRRGGDSLMGRYYYYHLHPFSLAEFLERGNEIVPFKEIVFQESGRETKEALEIALKFGGFPEPILKQSEREMRRWHNQRVERLVREDIRDMENIRELSLLQVLVDILPNKVGSLLSLNSLREDLSVAHKTVSKWMDVLERFYYHFRIYPFHHKKIRSLKKEPKLYLWDWSDVPDGGGSRLENIVASHLLKACHFLNDVEGYKTDLHFLRDIEGREVDFLVTENGKPWFAVEVKTTSKEISNNLLYFGSRLEIPFLYQVVYGEDVDLRKDKVRIVSMDRFLGSLV
ncbi:MAG: ATP-binding protein [Candidatus Omnitrophica bacterium]|nr:ATP-binding protein [Candidatus Omnitrophota bacterium]